MLSLKKEILTGFIGSSILIYCLHFSGQWDDCIESSTLSFPPNLPLSFILFLSFVQYGTLLHWWSISGKLETFRIKENLLEF